MIARSLIDFLRYSLVFCGVLVHLGPHPLAQQGQSLNSGPVTFSFAAVDKDGVCAHTISREDIKVTEDGRTQAIINLEPRDDVSVSSYLLIDISASQEDVIPLIRQSATSSINSLMRPGKDMTALATFTGRVSFDQKLTSNLKELEAALQNLKYVPPPTRLANKQTIYSSTSIWDAVRLTSEQLCAQSAGLSKRALIVISDGADNSSDSKLENAIEEAVRCNVAVFAIGITVKKYRELLDKPALNQLSDSTGAKAFFPKSAEELTSAFDTIGRIVRCEYVISFSPANKPNYRFRKIRIELIGAERKREKVRILHQVAYYLEKR